MRLTLDEISAMAGAQITSRGALEPTTPIAGWSHDSRTPNRGGVFWALKGGQHDGHEHLLQAVQQGAVAAVVHRLPTTPIPGLALLLCADTLIALQQFARAWRRRQGARFLGITGSAGKTTTKEFAASVLSQFGPTRWSKGSFNNHWGVPFSLMSVQETDRYAVIEMGMNHLGELRDLSQLVEPDAVVVTMVGRAHLEGTGGLEGVARAKAEIYEHAPPTCRFLFNLDNIYTKAMRDQWAKSHTQMTFSQDAGSGADLVMSAHQVSPTHLRVRGRILGQEGTAECEVFGTHHVVNLMAAAGLACLVGCEPRLVWQALGSCKTSWGRGQWVPLKSGARLLFDGYNANPDSMAAALAAFSQLPTERGGRRIVLLAEMRELGQESAACHEELGERAARGGFSAVGFYGPSAGAFRSGFLKAGGNEKNLFISDVYEITLASKWGLVLHPQDLLLIKGSRGMRTEKLVAQLDPVAASEWPP